MICKKCGNQIKEGAKFCNNCGYDLSNEPFDTDVSDENVQSITLKKEDENKIISYIKEMKLTVRETLTIKAAQVTSGGVKVKEINASTMESKIIKNLYFAGEVIDIDAETGGYNLQMAFSTGYLAGSDF